MSRYLVLILLNTPMVLMSLMNAMVAYKMGQIRKRRFVLRVLFWLAVFAGLVFAEPLYGFLFSRNLTQTEPLSLFDVIQITGIVATLFIANQAYTRVDQLERRVQELHRELSIRLSAEESKETKS